MGGGGGVGVAQQVSTLGEFHSAASSIAKSIHQVSQKLEHLTKREKQRGSFFACCACCREVDVVDQRWTLWRLRGTLSF